MKRILLAVSLLFGFGFASLFPSASSEKSARAVYEPPVVVSTSSVVYPITSIAWGTVILNVQLDAAGDIRSIETIQGIPSLTKPAIAAAKEWRFRPAMFRGKPVPSSVPLAFTFVPPSVGPRP